MDTFIFVVVAIALISFKVWLMVKHPEIDRRMEERHQARMQRVKGASVGLLKLGLKRWK